MQKLAALVLIAFVAVAASVAQAGPTPAQKCSASKIKATSKKAAAKLKCHEKAITKGVAVDPACLTKAEDKFTDAFAKAEAKSGCATTGDTNAIEALVDTFVDAAVVALEPPVSFASSVQPIFSASCATSGCHSGAFPAGNMNLESGQAYGNIVNVVSLEVPALKRVLPGAASSSYLYQKITNAMGIVGLPMPLGSYPMPSDDIDAIEAWINQGAQNN
jgi:hypothetical protein